MTTKSTLCADCGAFRWKPQHRLTRQADYHPFADPRRTTAAPPPKTYTRPQAYRDGFVEHDDPRAVAPAIGDPAIVTARGDLRLGIISKVGRTTVYVDVTTPTSPDLVTKGRIGGRWNERGYLKSASPLAACGAVNEGKYQPDARGIRCYRPAGHAGYHEGPKTASAARYGAGPTTWSDPR